MEDRNNAQEATMEEIKLSLQKLVQNSASNIGSPSSSNATAQVSPITMVKTLQIVSTTDYESLHIIREDLVPCKVKRISFLPLLNYIIL